MTLPLRFRYWVVLPIRIYSSWISPLKAGVFGTGACCRFSPSCSHYATEAILTHGVATGLWLGFKRICRCQPFGGYGHDPVPQPGLNHQPGNCNSSPLPTFGSHSKAG